MMRSSHTIPLLLIAALMLVACSDDDQPESGTTTDKQSATSAGDNRTAVERCSDDFTCSSEGRSVDTTLKRVGGECTAGGFMLKSDGSATSSDISNARWTSKDPNTFSICIEAGCLTCSAKNPRVLSHDDDSLQAKRKCTGSAAGCYGRAAGSCGSQNGCSFRQHSRIDYKGDLQLEYECEGSPDSCSSFRDETSCVDQSGCRWE